MKRVEIERIRGLLTSGSPVPESDVRELLHHVELGNDARSLVSYARSWFTGGRRGHWQAMLDARESDRQAIADARASRAKEASDGPA